MHSIKREVESLGNPLTALGDERGLTPHQRVASGRQHGGKLKELRARTDPAGVKATSGRESLPGLSAHLHRLSYRDKRRVSKGFLWTFSSWDLADLGP